MVNQHTIVLELWCGGTLDTTLMKHCMENALDDFLRKTKDSVTYEEHEISIVSMNKPISNARIVEIQTELNLIGRRLMEERNTKLLEHANEG